MSAPPVDLSVHHNPAGVGFANELFGAEPIPVAPCLTHVELQPNRKIAA